jgi:hypothetical protein
MAIYLSTCGRSLHRCKAIVRPVADRAASTITLPIIEFSQRPEAKAPILSGPLRPRVMGFADQSALTILPGEQLEAPGHTLEEA